MLELTLSGTPYEIGYQHGSGASELVKGSIQFYEKYFLLKSKMDWESAKTSAARFLPNLEANVPHLIDEMRGIAAGAGVPFESILALNVRSEISMGMMDDGCTTLAWKTDGFSVAGQNWDWEDDQGKRLVLVHICPKQDDGADAVTKPNISQVTEAGIVGKIGLNSYGVAVFLNAIRARGANFEGLPLHVALRVALESRSRLKAIARIQSLGGCGTAGHILVADPTGATSLEFSVTDKERCVVPLEMINGQIAHTNHFLADHLQVDKENKAIFTDTYSRMARAKVLLSESAEASTPTGASDAVSRIEHMLEDEDNFPVSINRKSSLPENRSSTLFNIVTDLGARRAVIKAGRPTECKECFAIHVPAP